MNEDFLTPNSSQQNEIDSINKIFNEISGLNNEELIDQFFGKELFTCGDLSINDSLPNSDMSDTSSYNLFDNLGSETSVHLNGEHLTITVPEPLEIDNIDTHDVKSLIPLKRTKKNFNVTTENRQEIENKIKRREQRLPCPIPKCISLVCNMSDHLCKAHKINNRCDRKKLKKQSVESLFEIVFPASQIENIDFQSGNLPNALESKIYIYLF